MSISTLLGRSMRNLRMAAGGRKVTSAEVRKAYEVVLRRPADPQGLAAYTDSIVMGHQTILEVVDALLGSDEYIAQNAPVEVVSEVGLRFDRDRSSTFVRGLYQIVLQREADESGLDSHLRKLEEGADLLDIVSDFLASSEFAGRFTANVDVDVAQIPDEAPVADAAGAVLGLDRDRATTFIQALYRTLLQREADDDGLDSYLNKLDQGADLMDIVDDFLASSEYASKVTMNAEEAPVPHKAPVLDSAEKGLPLDRERSSSFVRGLYQTLLQREADEGGLDSYLHRLDDGADLIEIVNDFLASSEYASKFTMNVNVARKIAETLLIQLTTRDPGPLALGAYTQSLASGSSLVDFVNELKRSPEFITSRAVAPDYSEQKAPPELAVLAQDFIALHMAREGAIVALPPLMMVGAAPVAIGQMAALIHTLAMLGAGTPRAAGLSPRAAVAER